MTVKEIEGRCWFACIGLLLLSRNMSSGKSEFALAIDNRHSPCGRLPSRYDLNSLLVISLYFLTTLSALA